MNFGALKNNPRRSNNEHKATKQPKSSTQSLTAHYKSSPSRCFSLTLSQQQANMELARTQLVWLQALAALVMIGSLAIALPTSSQLIPPLVETGPSELSPDGVHVGVRVPGVYKLQLDTRGPNKGVRLSQSVMAGLVTVNMDRQMGENGRMTGPIRVTFAGIPMYDNGVSGSGLASPSAAEATLNKVAAKWRSRAGAIESSDDVAAADTVVATPDSSAQ